MQGEILKPLLISLAFAPLLAWADAPQRVLRNMDGSEAAIADYHVAGKWQLVMIWATDCSVCRIEMPRMSTFSERAETNVTVLGVAIDGFAARAAIQGFIDNRELPFPNLVAEMPEFAFRYEGNTGERLLGTPTYLLFDPAGKLVANNPGPLSPADLMRFIAGKSGA